MKIGWGILGTGRIAAKFAPDLALAPACRAVAVGSRDAARARDFASRFAIPRAHGSYLELVQDPEVDVVYVASPHPWHREHCLLAIDHGKAVLCEKPFAMSAAEAGEVVSRARARGVFLMEGMWTRFFPAMTRLREFLRAGLIGEVRAIHAAFGFRAAQDPADRLLNKRLGGGALLDVGIYPLSLAAMVLGTDLEVRALSHIGATGVDEQTALLLRSPTGAVATLACAVRTELPGDAFILGTHGRIHVPAPFWRPRELRWEKGHEPGTGPRGRLLALAHHLRGRLPAPLERAAGAAARRLLLRGPGRRERFAERGHGFHHEIAHVAACLRDGRHESAIMPLDETVAILELMDRARAAIGLHYDRDDAS